LRDAPPETLLAEDTAHNGQPENAASQNLLLKGDNLEILKHLKHAYAGAVKMIYIDPPYNTGSDGFVYQDDRRFTPEQLARLGGMDLDEACRVLEFTAKKSNSHSAWLTFMYPRLYIARELLREDGVIFISIDDNEQAQLKILCDEVFGEENFVGNFIWHKKITGGYDNDHLNTQHEYILIYVKQINNFKMNFEQKESSYTLQDKNGKYFKWDSLWNVGGLSYSPSLDYPITAPDGSKIYPIGERGVAFWLWSKEKVEREKDELKFTKDKTGKWKVYKKVYASDAIVPASLLDKEIVKGNTQSSAEIKNLFGGVKVFKYAKPVALIKYLIDRAINPTDLILDFFAGSGTTAHAVMQLNAEDGENGRRRFILAQLPEPTDKKSEAYKAGYETIFQITQARLEKAAAKIRADYPHYTGDLGFKIFTTVPRFQAASDEAFDPQQPLLPESVRADLNSEQLDTLLTTWRVYDGCPLTAPVRPLDLAGYTAHLCGDNVYFMAAGCTSQTVKALIEKLDTDADFAPERVIFYGANMASAMQRELAQAVEGYANKKSLKLNVLARY
jgi:hypothetical protein